ncbi:MAG TPA: hypothetical protein PK760_09920, partial [Flavobacteriales bacterium]|nr:hypothetical protein [Flavobacteriales bacterium]
AGVGASYMYQRNAFYQPAITFNAYGYRTFTRYRFLDHFFAHAEFLHLNLQKYDQLADNFGRIWVPHVLMGGGYIQQGGGRGSLYLQVLVEVLQDPNSIYRYQQGPIISAGFGIGF